VVKLSVDYDTSLDLGDYIRSSSFNYHRKGDVVFSNEVNTRPGVLFVHEGKLEMTTRLLESDIAVSALGPGTFFGEESLLTTEPAYLPRVTVTTNCKVFRLSKEGFQKLIRLRPEFLYFMLKNVIRKLNALEHTITDVLERYKRNR